MEYHGSFQTKWGRAAAEGLHTDVAAHQLFKIAIP